jgi:hypothetical protein
VRGSDGGDGSGEGTGGGRVWPAWYSRCSRRVALPKGAGCLELAFAPSAPRRGAPAATFSGGGAAAAALQSRWFAAAAALWEGARGPAANLAAALELDPPPPARRQAAALAALRRPLPPLGAAADDDDARGDGGEGSGSEAGSEAYAVEEDDHDDDDEEEEEGACGICYALLLRDPTAGDGHPGDVPDAACDAAGGCSRPFHSRCLAEWVRGLPGSRRCFATLFGQCPYCSAPVAVRAP